MENKVEILGYKIKLLFDIVKSQFGEGNKPLHVHNWGYAIQSLFGINKVRFLGYEIK